MGAENEKGDAGGRGLLGEMKRVGKKNISRRIIKCEGSCIGGWGNSRPGGAGDEAREAGGIKGGWILIAGR